MSSVAVIIPTADRPELLMRAVKSVLMQSRSPEQVIVVDNGNEALSLEGLDHRVMIVRTQPRIGPGRSRNVGVMHAETDYVAFLDDDDIWDSDYLKYSMSLAEQVSASVVVGRLKRRVVSTAFDKDYKLFPSCANSQRSIYYKNPGFGGQNILLKRALFSRLGGFDQNMPASVDRDLAARILQSGEAIYVQDKSVAILCDHEGERVRASQVRGNRMFLAKHWRHMTTLELCRALKTYIVRLVRNKFL